MANEQEQTPDPRAMRRRTAVLIVVNGLGMSLSAIAAPMAYPDFHLLAPICGFIAGSLVASGCWMWALNQELKL